MIAHNGKRMSLPGINHCLKTGQVLEWNTLDSIAADRFHIRKLREQNIRLVNGRLTGV